MRTRLVAVALLASLSAFLAAPASRAEIRTEVVEYRHGEVVLEGFLAWDDQRATEKTPQPGVLVCPEWWGNNDYARSRAKQLAELGYVGFSLDVYGKGKITTDPQQASAWSSAAYADVALLRARTRLAYDLLAARKFVDKTKLAAIGYCMGGTVALELARSGAPLRSVVAFHAGKLTSLGSAEDNAKITAAVTVCHGQEDAFVTAEEIAGFHEQMKAAKRDYQFLSYAYAVHAFTNPGADAFKIPGVAYDAAADRRSWAHMKLAFAEAFAR
ncbi:MAG: dienelactone hydrolase family protein [Planctomycetes bacterium]|nr:dienelactone hydrolase family protein [Planctomycetota bacterium]